MSRLDSLIDVTLDFSRLLRRTMAERGSDICKVNMLQIHGLGLIREKDGMTMRELADLLKITPGTASVFVGRLVKSKWVKRKADSANRTFVHLHLTTDGKKVLRESGKFKHDVLKHLFSVIPAADQRLLKQIFGKLNQSLSDHPKA